MNAIVKLITIVTIVIIIALALGFYDVASTYAMGAGTGRHNGCHTYNVWGHESEVIDAVFCGMPADDGKQKKSEDNSPAPVVVTESPSVAPAPEEEKSPVVETPNNDPAPMPEEKPSDTCDNGNPGNKKCVGKAGEDPNGRGTMPLDSADGNGEHGNQGQGGNRP